MGLNGIETRLKWDSPFDQGEVGLGTRMEFWGGNGINMG